MSKILEEIKQELYTKDLRQWARGLDQVCPIRLSNEEVGLTIALLRKAANKIEELEKEREVVVADLRERLKETKTKGGRIGYQYAIMVLENPD